MDQLRYGERYLLQPAADFCGDPVAAAGSRANFLPAPIASITYGISTASNPPMPGNPVPGDTTLTNTIACPTSSYPTDPVATVFTPPQQSIPITGGDGMYLIHYFARDCASTEELKFTQDMTGSWSTSFYTVPVNVDTQPPRRCHWTAALPAAFH